MESLWNYTNRMGLYVTVEVNNQIIINGRKLLNSIEHSAYWEAQLYSKIKSVVSEPVLSYICPIGNIQTFLQKMPLNIILLSGPMLVD